MQLKTIVYSTDFSPASQAALPLATALARDSGATLVIAHAVEPPTVYSAGDFAIGLPMTEERTREALDELAVPDPQVKVERRLLDGEPARALVRLADELNADLIVMGTHGRTGLSRLVMGSVAEGVMRGAHCPVLTYRHLPPEDAGQRP
jgi:nucleotide-binding universal stress UspA family protein